MLSQGGSSPSISIPSCPSSLLTSFITSLVSGQAFNKEEHLLASLLHIIVPPQVQKIPEPQNVEQVVDSKSWRKYNKSGISVQPSDTIVTVQKLWEETPRRSFLDENHKQTFKIKSETTKSQANCAFPKHPNLEKEHHTDAKEDSKLLLKSTLCDVCSKTFVNKYILKAHMKTHQEKTHICNFCKKSYSDQNTLKTHILLHSQEKIQCQVCFATVTRIRRHMKNKHGDRKLVTCTICGQDKIGRTIAGHEKICRMSKEERAEYKESIKVKCANCHKILANKDKLARHIQTVHSNSKLFQCKHCDHKDNRSDNMKTHIKNNHQ